MKFKNISLILTILSFILKVLSVPLNENELSFNDKENSEKSENVIGSIKVLEDEIYDTLTDDDIDISINVTDAVVEEETDSDSDDEVESVLATDTNECTSEECIETSKRILNTLDISVNPCDDFFEFSCGGWIAENNEKTDGYSLNNLRIDKIKADLIELLESDYKVKENLSPNDKEYDEKLFNIMKNNFNACVNNINKEKNGVLINFINNLNINETLSKPDGITYLFAEIHNYGIDMLFRINISAYNYPHEYNIPDIENNYMVLFDFVPQSFLEIELSKEGRSYQGGFKNEDEYNHYIQKQYKIIDIYQDYVRKVLQSLYDQNDNNNKIDSKVESIISVEKELSRIYLDALGPDFLGEIYSTEPTDDYEYNEEDETMNYNFENFGFENGTDFLFNDEQNTDYEYDPSQYMDLDSHLLIDINTLNEKYPLINWKLYFEKRFEFYDLEVSITEESPVYEDDTLKYLFKYLDKINTKDLANYIEWSVINKLLDASEYFVNEFDMYKNIIPFELIKIHNEYEKSLYEVYYEEEYKNENENEVEYEEENKAEYEIFPGNDANTQCLNYIYEYMSLVLSKYYVEKVFPEDSKLEFKDMIENIRNAMINRINELEWLDSSTREFAMEKVLKIKYLIGHSDYIMNVENIYNKYMTFEKVNENSDSIYLYFFKDSYSKKEVMNSIYKENYNREIQFDAELFVLNALYYKAENTMLFPASILQSSNFDINQPDYLNYGSIGTIMGHELTHAFDNTGKDYDAEGREKEWWTDNDNEEFNELSQCFVNQYGNYSYEIKEKKYYVNGENTLGENLADNGGLDRSFEAWKISIEKNPEKATKRNMKLPGLSDYSMEQLFYISYAQNLCEVGYDKFYLFDSHSPRRFRINGSVSNSKRFAKIFNCPADSPMNPNNKCTLW